MNNKAIYLIQIEQIRNVSKDVTQDGIEKYVEMLKNDKLIQPIVVKKITEDLYMLKDGSHRICAHLQCGKDSVLAHII